MYIEILCLKYEFSFQENIWLKRMKSTDTFLVPSTEEQKISNVVFDVPISEMKSNYKFYSLQKNHWQVIYLVT